MRPLLVVTEGVLDILCLTRLSQIVRSHDSRLPDLEELTGRGQVVFLPAGGGDLAAWIDRLVPLACHEFHLYDREQEPESSLRQQIVDRINARPNCRAVLTNMRSLENYLHPTAIQAVFGVEIEVTDQGPVAELVARAHPDWDAAWAELSYRARKRLVYHTKRRLSTEAMSCMTAEMLAERDPAGEVLGWFQEMARLLSA